VDQERKRIARGALVDWTSHGGGWPTRKEGRVVALVPAGVDPLEICPELRSVPKSRIKFDMRPAAVDRYVIRVFKTSRHGGLVYYYGPRADFLERAVADDR